MKKQRKSPSSSSSSEWWSESEKEIAETIRDLHSTMPLFSSVPFTWRCKRNRSAIQTTPPPPTTIINHRAVNPPAVVVPPPSTNTVKIEAPSPETPLSFPATESDDKPIHHHSIKKTSLKKEKESSLQIIQDLTITKSDLNQEIEKVKQHYDQLKSFNLKLKIKKQELLCSTNGHKSEFKTPKLVIDQKVQLLNGSVNASESTAENVEHEKEQQHQQQQIEMFPNDQTMSFAVGSSSSTSVGLGRNVNNNGPIALPDLNLPTEESVNVESFEPLDEETVGTNRAIVAAEARHRRFEICRLKKPFGNNNNNSKQHQ